MVERALRSLLRYLIDTNRIFILYIKKIFSEVVPTFIIFPPNTILLTLAIPYKHLTCILNYII